MQQFSGPYCFQLKVRLSNGCHSLPDHRRELAFSISTMRSTRPCQWRWGCCHGNCVFSVVANGVSSYWLRLREPCIILTITRSRSVREVQEECFKKTKNMWMFFSLSLSPFAYKWTSKFSMYLRVSHIAVAVEIQLRTNEDVCQTSTHSYICGEARVSMSICLFLDQSKRATTVVRLTCFWVYMCSWTEFRHERFLVMLEFLQ